jgi:HSP20 family protein
MALERRRPRREILAWRPWRDLEEVEWHLDDLFRRHFGKPDGETWMPAVDVFEKDDKFIVKAELPGMKDEDVDVEIVGDILKIKGEKKAESEVKKEDYHRSERSYGSFYRSIPIPSTVDTDKIEASFEDGVLEVTLPKLAGAKKKKKVKVAARKRASKTAK